MLLLITGSLTTKPIYVGSRHERSGFFLVQDDGSERRVEAMVESGIPESTLRGFVGKRCRVRGRLVARVLYVIKIEEVSK